MIEPDLLLPPEAVRSEPPAVYSEWYREMEVCVGLAGTFALVRWFAVPGEHWWDPLRQQYATGTWRAPHDIYIAASHALDALVVKHEAIHDLLRGGDADDPAFRRCSGIGH